MRLWLWTVVPARQPPRPELAWLGQSMGSLLASQLPSFFWRTYMSSLCGLLGCAFVISLLLLPSFLSQKTPFETYLDHLQVVSPPPSLFLSLSLSYLSPSLQKHNCTYTRWLPPWLMQAPLPVRPVLLRPTNARTVLSAGACVQRTLSPTAALLTPIISLRAMTFASKRVAAPQVPMLRTPLRPERGGSSGQTSCAAAAALRSRRASHSNPAAGASVAW